MADAVHLETVADFVTDARRLLLDQTQPYRYPDPDLLVGLNTALLEGRRLRADLFVTRWGSRVPGFLAVSGETVGVEPQFRLGFLYGMVAHVLLRDTEDVQDERANTFLAKFHDILVGVRPSPIQGGTPAPTKKG